MLLEETSSAKEQLKKALLDTFFPLFCLGCNEYGDWLCPACLAGLPIRIEQRCPVCCENLTPRGERCFSCHDTRALDGLFAASTYQSSLLSYVIHSYKYRFFPDIARPLGSFLVRTLQSKELALPDLIIPVPLHPARLRFRGFNQAELLAQFVSNALLPDMILPIRSDILVRTRPTKPQMKTGSRKERLANLSRVFSVVTGSREIKGKHLWLIDDVSTTGSTLAESARALKKAGAASVFGIVLAR